MPLLFAHPAVAWLLPVVALPVLFHLFFRLRRQVREFPSLMFFLRIDPRLSAKRKIHEWLVLFLRCLFLALLILALARPLVGNKGSGTNVARLVLIDNSGSMAGATTGAISKLTLAERATQRLIASSRPGDSVAVQLMIPDPTITLPRGFDVAPALLGDAIGKLTPSDGAAPVAKAIRTALATLDTAKSKQRELVILTDLQQKNWSRGDLDPEPGNRRIIVHRLESPPLTAGSVSLELVAPPSHSIPAGRLTAVHVALQNHGPVAAEVRLNSADDSGKSFSRNMEVAPNSATSAILTFSFNTPGFHWAQVWLEGDAMPMANRAELGFWATDVQKVVFAGTRNDFAAMPYAISPGGNADLSGMDGIFIGADSLIANLATKPLAVVLTWENWPQDETISQALQNYVRQGGTLFLVPSPDAGNSVPPPTASWIKASLGALTQLQDAEPVMLFQAGDELWADLRDADGQPKLGLLRAFQYRSVQTGAGWQVLIASAKGGTLLARQNLERGRVFASGLAFSPKWSSLPLKGGFVVLMQNALLGGETAQIPVQSISASGEIHFDLPDTDVAVKSLAGSALDWRGKAKDFEGPPRAGIYEISQRDHVSWVAASGDPDEADPHFLVGAQVPLLRNLPHEVVPLLHEDDLTQTESAPGSGTSLYRWFLLCALLVLLAETWLANERSSDLGTKLFGALTAAGMPRKAPAQKRTKA